MPKFRKKPIVIEAMQWDGKNITELLNWSNPIKFCKTFLEDCIEIETLEGSMKASLGDWVIKGISGEFYPCKPDIFEKTYEKVEE